MDRGGALGTLSLWLAPGGFRSSGSTELFAVCSRLPFCLGTGVRSLGNIQRLCEQAPRWSGRGASQREAERRRPGHECRYSAPGWGNTMNPSTQKPTFSPPQEWKNHSLHHRKLVWWWSPQLLCRGTSSAKGTAGQGCRGEGTTGSVIHPGPRPGESGLKPLKLRL